MKALLAALALVLPYPAAAVMPSKAARAAAKKHGLSAPRPAFSLPTVSDEMAQKAVESFNANHPSGIGPARLGAAAAGGGAGGEASAGQLAPAFLTETQASLGIDPQQLQLLNESRGESGDRHALYRQIYKGLPVEFSRIKVHFDAAGKAVGVNSNFRPHLDLDVRPLVAASVAAYTVRKDVDEEPASRPELVVMLDPNTAAPRLAWKVTAVKDGKWRYYVDAHSGEIIMRYDDRRYVCGAAQAQGRVLAQIYTLDQDHGTPQNVAVPNMYVYNPNASTHTITAGSYAGASSGTYCFDSTTTNSGVGKIHAALQGPYVRVANFRGISASYENNTKSSGTWTAVALAAPVSSAHPYANDANDVRSVDTSAVVTDANAVAVRPVFTNFNTGLVTGGAVGEAADIADDDQVTVFDDGNHVSGGGYPVGHYVGNRGGFEGPYIEGKKFSVRLKSNSAGTNYGYDLSQVKWLKLENKTINGTTDGTTDAGPGGQTNGSFTWVPAKYNVTGLRAEAAAFVHLNQMHDYFSIGANGRGPNNPASGAATVGFTPVAAMVLMGPNLLNAFYDPDFDALYFGDVNATNPTDAFTDDSTVTRHEYVHYVMQKIWNIQNFGEAGAISEAVADYFALSSLDSGNTTVGRVTGLGTGVNQALGGAGPLRQLASTPGYKLSMTPGSCGANCENRPWNGEIHDDSIFVSQALWDMRQAMISGTPALGFDRTAANNGINCADKLVFQAMKFFPESFFELRQALLESARFGVNSCGATSLANLQAAINTAFANHAIPIAVGDAYDTVSKTNNGFETAVDISEINPVTATISPASDIDFYTFPAGPGMIELELSLPAVGDFYSGYMLTVYDKNHVILTQALADYDGFDTNAGLCVSHNCTTTSSKIKHRFFNGSAQQIFLQVSGGPTDNGFSNSAVTNGSPYTLKATYQKPGAVAGGIVTATLDADVISYEVSVATWFSLNSQDFRFSYARLRDHAQNVLPNTDAPAQDLVATKYLAVNTPAVNALGKISGQVRLQNGFNARFPSLGTVHLEVFGYNVYGSTYSLGLSQPLNLATDKSEARVWNNVFDPTTGAKTTLRFDVREAGRLTAKIYTMGGTFVQTLFDGDVQAGKGSVDWRGQNSSGVTVASGVYLLHIQGPGIKKTQKIAVIK